MTLPAAEAIFLALADVEPPARAAVLDERCGGDAALRLEVESLLSTLDAPDDEFLDPQRIPSLDMSAVDGPLQPGSRLGSFLTHIEVPVGNFQPQPHHVVTHQE